MRTRGRTMFLAMLVCLGSAGTSTVEAVHVFAGGRAAYTNTDLVGASDDGIGTKNSGLGGFILGWHIAPWFSAHSGLDVSQKGATLEDLGVGELPTSIAITYVEIPMLG